ncbi:hypothetical protein D3C85_1170380 [compost metagenome]
MRGLDRRADTGGDFIADHDRIQQGLPAGVAFFGQRQRRGDGRTSRVIDRIAEDVVEFHGMRNTAVDPGRGGGKGGGRAARQAGGARAQFRAMRAQQLQARGGASAGIQRREPIQEGALGVMDDLVGQSGQGVPRSVGGDGVQQHVSLRGLLRRNRRAALVCRSL